jgi:DNA-binding CsgD family transcriptional regulator
MAQDQPASVGLVWPLVGRERELALIEAALDDGTCHGIGLLGAAGVGKTRLARTVVELGAARGMTPVMIRATATATDFPFAALTPLFLELGVDLGHVDQPMLAIARAINDRVRDGGLLLLVVDDAPLLDSASRSVIDQLAGMAGTFLVLTVREGTSEASPSFDLWKDDRFRRLVVEPLDATDLMTLIQVALGGPVDGATLRSLTDACSGNLLLLRELVLGALESGLLSTPHGIWRLNGSVAASPRLQSLIDHRLRAVTATLLETLEVIALGEPLDAALVADLESHQSVEALEREGLIESALEHGTVMIRFTHPLYAEMVRAQISPTRRARLYRSLADATDRLGAGATGNGGGVGAGRPGNRDPQRDLRVAVWRLEGGGGDPASAIDAARFALRRKNFGLAARLARSSWEASGSVEAAIVLSNSLDLYGRSEDVVPIMQDAYPKAVTDQDITALAVRYASALYRWPDRGDEADAVLSEAYERVTDPSCRRLIEAQRSAHLLRTGDVARSLTVGTPLLADRSDPAFAVASVDIGIALSLAGRPLEALRHLDEFAAIPTSEGSPNRLWVVDILMTARVHALLEAGQVGEALQTVQSAYERVLELGHPDARAWVACFLGGVLTIQGDLKGAERACREGSALFQELGHPGERWALAGLALATGQMGLADEATAAVTLMDSLPRSGWGLMDTFEDRGRAWTAAASGDLASATSILWDQVASSGRGGQLASMAGLLHDLVRIGRDRGAAVQLESLEGPVEGALMSARASLARAVLGDDPIQAADAADRFERCGTYLYAAEAASLENLYAAAAGLQRRASDAGHRSARLLQRCEGARTPALGATGEEARLSAREREVAFLASQGLTNATIAEKLFLSKRTVENHLQRAYTKLGVAGRGELAEALAMQPAAVPRG